MICVVFFYFLVVVFNFLLITIYFLFCIMTYLFIIVIFFFYILVCLPGWSLSGMREPGNVGKVFSHDTYV